MFCELNSIKHIIVRPPDSFGPQHPLWPKLSGLGVPLTLLVPENVRGAWGNPGGSVQVMPWNAAVVPQALGNVKTALEVMDAKPCETVYVTWSARDLGAVVNSRVGTLLVGHPPQDSWPDIYVPNEKGIFEAIKTVMSGGQYGYIGEAIAEGLESGKLKGFGDYRHLKLDLDTRSQQTTSLYALGRYITNEDDRAKKHLFSQQIKECSKNGRPIESLPRALAEVLRDLLKKQKVDLIVGVPPRPGSNEWGLGWIIEQAISLLNSKDGGAVGVQKYAPEKLRCIRNYAKQKTLGRKERRENVRGAFLGQGLDGGERVLLIDDIFTTGATTAECVDTLVTAGASEVAVLVLGHSVTQAIVSHSIPCKPGDCEGQFAPRFNKKKAPHKAFWGCSDFKHCPARTSGCCQGPTMNWRDGVQQLNDMNSVDEIRVLVCKDVEF